MLYYYLRGDVAGKDKNKRKKMLTPWKWKLSSEATVLNGTRYPVCWLSTCNFHENGSCHGFSFKILNIITL